MQTHTYKYIPTVYYRSMMVPDPFVHIITDKTTVDVLQTRQNSAPIYVCFYVRVCIHVHKNGGGSAAF